MSDLSQRTIHAGNRWSDVVTVAGEWILALFGFRRRRVTYDGIEFEVLEGRGRGGPDVVLLHGLGDRNSTWHRLLWRMRLGRWGRIYAPDLTGFGRTLLPEGRTLPTMDEGLGLMRGVIAQMTDKPPILVGNSLGGWLAWRFVLRYPESALGCLLLAPGGFMERRELKPLVGRFLHGERHEMTDAIMADARPEMRFFALRIIGHMLESPMVEVVVEQDSSELLCEPGELAAIADRVRCLWGELDTLMPESGLPMLREELGDHLVVEPIGHAPQQTRPGMVLRELKALHAQLTQVEPSVLAGEPAGRLGEPEDALEPPSHV